MIESEMLFSPTDIPIAELPASRETPEQQLGHAVKELLNQAFDAFGLHGKGTVTRILGDPNEPHDKPEEDELERLHLKRTNYGGSLDVNQRQHGVERSIHLAYRESPTGKILLVDVDHNDSGDGLLTGEAALLPIVEAFSDSSIFPKPRTI